MNKIHFKIITPEKTVYENEVDQATLPVSDGEVTILPNHRSYIASLKSGEVMLRIGNEEIHMAVSGGFVEFDNNTLTVLADTAEHAEDIDEKRAEEARKRAEELKTQKINMSEEEFARTAALVEKEIHVARQQRSHCRALPPVRHMDGIDLGGIGKLRPREMARRAVACRRIVQYARPCAGGRQQVGASPDAGIRARIDQQHKSRTRDAQAPVSGKEIGALANRVGSA